MPRYDTPITVVRRRSQGTQDYDPVTRSVINGSYRITVWDRWGDVLENSASVLGTRNAATAHILDQYVDILGPHMPELLGIPPGQLTCYAQGRTFEVDEILFSGDRKRRTTLRCHERLQVTG